MIIVLGTGRCGTSTIARLLHTKLGISMGERFREPDKSNYRGFYEDLDFRDLNQLILSNQIANSYFQEKLNELIAKRKEPFGIKDPRICHLWQAYRPYPAQYIICTRRPQLIVKSLIACYGWTEEESKQLVITRLHGIDKLLEGHDALRIDFSGKRTETELINLLKRYI